MDPSRHRLAVELFADRYGRPPARADLSALRLLLHAFAKLPYENLSKIVAWNGGQSVVTSAERLPLRDPLTVMQDHLALGTGGTCFSLTELLRQLVGTSGISAYPVMAHMRHGPNIHCALRVELRGGGWLVDPGYLLPEPLPLGGDPKSPKLPRQPWLVTAGSLPGVPEGVPPGDFDLFTLEAEGPRWRYRFSDRAPSPEEFRSHWRRSFQLPGMRSMLCSRRTEEAFLYLHNHKLRRQQLGQVETQNLRATLQGSVQELFGIHPSITQSALTLLEAERQAWRRRL